MRQILSPLAAAASLLISLASAPADDFAIRDGDTVGFLGDSITAAGVYGRHIENYTLLRYPDRKARFLNLGIGGDTAAGGLKRLQRDVFDQNVTLLTVAFGVNDIVWGMKADDEHRQRYLDGIRGIVEACRERGVRVYICSAAVTGADPDKTENDFLQRMCDEGLAIARKAGAGTIDVQRTMRDIQRRVRNANEGKPADQHETLHAADGVHLSELGQLAMAYAILKGLGAPEEVSHGSVDAAQLTVIRADGCTVSEITREGDSLSFVRQDEGLPFNNGLLATLSYRFVPMNELSRYRLTVRNLRTGRYGLSVDGREIGTWTAEQLAAGINIASTTPDPWQPGGPWDAQAGMLKSLTEARHNVQAAVRQARAYLHGSSLSDPFAEQSHQTNEHLEQLQRQAARPRAFHFVLARLEDQTKVTSPLEYQVFQRTSAERGPVRVQGTTTLDVDQVQLQVRGKPKQGALPEGWQSVEFNPADGVFQKELTLPAGGWYALDLRFLKEGQPVHEQTIERFGVGEVFVGAGQSNSTNSGQFKTQQTSGMVASFSGEHWQLADDPQPGVADKSQGGSYYPAFGDRLYEVYKVPIGIAATGFGGTSVNQWQPPDGLFAWMMKRIDQLGPHGFRAVLWHQGESDVGMTSDEYYQKLKNVIETSRKKAGWEIPWFVAQVSYHNPDKPSFESTRTAQAKLWEDGVALEGPDTDTLTGDHRDFDGKGIHFSPKGLKAHGLMWAEKVRPWIDKALAEAKVSSAAADDPPKMEPVRISEDGTQFVLGESGEAFVPWGFNYLGQFGKLVEDSWDTDWERLERDFRNMRRLGANVVRIHLQFGTYMKGRGKFDQEQLDRLRKLLDLARDNGLYLDVTGLSCYRLDQIPKWYDELDETDRWDAQAGWWQQIARTCAGHPALFCYDLMNEPIIGGQAEEGEPRWVGGELGGFYFVQRISEEAKDRTRTEIARAWSEKLTAAIRREDPRTPITVGVIPWAHVWPNAKPVFYAPDVLKHFDFVSIHLYPGKGEVDKAVAALAPYDLGKPLVVEETFPLNCTLEEVDRFIEGGRNRVDGWISHYFGYTIEQHRQGAEPHGVAPDAPFNVMVADFLAYWRDKGKVVAGTTPEGHVSRADPRPKSVTAAALLEGLLVRGSVEQIHIARAEPNAAVTVKGPDGFQQSAETDEAGALILHDVPPGNGYRVRIGNREGDDHTVRVLSQHEHPGADFYKSQTLEPTQGYITTRDGTLLSYRVMLPDADVHGDGPYDLLITYSGYQPGLETQDGHQDRPFEQFSELGYAVAGVNMRGSGCSGGAFNFMEPLTWLDGYDMVEAFSAQPWVDDVALGDQSWPGLTQLFVASTQPPSLDAIVAGSVVGDFYRDVFFPGGIQNVGFGHIWAAGRDVENAWPSRRKEVIARAESDPVCAANQALRSQNIKLVEMIKTHIYDDEYWQSRVAQVEKITVPTLQIVSWQDPQVGGRPAILAEQFPDETPMKLVGINGFHQYWSGDVWDEIVRFLDVYLGDTPPEELARYEAQNDFIVLLESDDRGTARGRFTVPDFTAAGDGQRMVLGADLVPDDADDTGSVSTFTYAPSQPGAWTNSQQDRATFTSTPLAEQTAMAGSGSVDLWIAADAEDVDLQVTLSEVRPDGQEMLVQSGWLRASHRALDESGSTVLRPRQLHTADSVEKLVPGEWTPLRIELFPFAHLFRKGSRIRLSVSRPGGAVNAWPWAFDALEGEFDVRVSHDDGDHASSVVLPVVQPAELDVPASLPAHDAVWLQPSRALN